MTITVEEGKYVVVLPEHGVLQDINPDTRQPFASEADAQAWQDAFMDSVAAAHTAAEAAAAAAEQSRLDALLHLDIVADNTAAAIGAQINITATLKNGHGNTVPVGQTFAVPIEDGSGNVARIKGVTLVDGVANVSLTFDKSGYYRITEQGINAKLDGLHIGLPAPFEVTVFE